MVQSGGTFRVRIHYREPTYEVYSGHGSRHYHWTYSIEAQNGREAKLLALAEFRDMARRSSVSWSREVVAVELEGGAA